MSNSSNQSTIQPKSNKPEDALHLKALVHLSPKAPAMPAKGSPPGMPGTKLSQLELIHCLQTTDNTCFYH